MRLATLLWAITAFSATVAQAEQGQAEKRIPATLEKS